MKLKTLSIITSVLFALSLVVFVNENKRGTELLTGSDYIKGLDVAKVQQIVLHFQGEERITLTRDGNRFVLEDHKQYPAASDKVNDLIYHIASVQVKEKVVANASDDDLKKYELDDESRKYLIELFDNDSTKTVSFRVGKSYKGRGNYLYKDESKDIYLSQGSVRINSSHKDFIDTILLDIKEEDIEQVKLVSDKEIELQRKEEEFILVAPQSAKFKKEKADEYIKNFSSVRFDDYYPHAEPQVRTLNFNKDIKIQLKNKLIYKVSLAKNKEDYFAKLNALIGDIPNQIVVNKNDGKEKLQNIEDMVKAQGDAQRVNREKGSWIYKIDKSVYENLVKDSTFFL